MPIRKIPKNYRSVTGTFASIKNGCNIFYESLLERDFFLTLEFDENVKSYEEQPIQIFYKHLNKNIRYTPDCLVHYKDNRLPCIYEVKYSNEIKEKKVFLKQKFDQIEEYLDKNDMEFKLFTELDINPIYLENIKFLYNFSVLKDISKTDLIKKLFKNKKLESYENILKIYSTNKYEQAEIIPYIWHLVLTNYLTTDLNKPFSKKTILKVKDNDKT